MFRVTELEQNYSVCMTEIQGKSKSILVGVSARFELASVRVIGSRLYFVIERLKPNAKIA